MSKTLNTGNRYKNLFLQQSYFDNTDLYSEILRRERTDDSHKLPVWDYVILSASNEAQAMAYEQQISWRLKNRALPAATKYAVIPDPEGKRVGSGGATLNVLRYITEHDEREISQLRIMVLHSGGDAKRTPQYSACGKIFSPVPRMLPNGRRSTLFDEFMISMCGIPARISSGMLVCSGDVLLLFNSLQLDFYEEGAAALSIKESAEVGKNHGVFLGSGDGYVRRFLHKQSVENLKKVGAADQRGMINIDTGAVIFSGGLVKTLYSLADTPEKFAAMVNEKVRLSFYADFLYPLAEDSTLEQFYKEQPEGDLSPELDAAREKIWEKLSGYRMKLIRFSPSSFLHFGTTRELLKLNAEDIGSYGELGWRGVVNSNYHGEGFAASNSYISTRAKVGAGSYIEDSYIHHNAVIGKGCVISGCTIGKARSGKNEKPIVIPDGTVVHGLKLADGRFVVRVYGVNDNPKEAKLFGKEIDEPLWTKPLYPAERTFAEALNASLSGEAKGELFSLKDSFNGADVTAILPWQEKLNDKIKIESLLEAIDANLPAEQAAEIFKTGISERVKNKLLKMAEKLDCADLGSFSRKIRIYYYLSKLTDEEKNCDRCFETIRDTILRTALKDTDYRADYVIAKDEVVTKLPVRVNWGGGWSDTPPYCMEHGGTVLNAAIKLGGELPIEVTIKKLPESKMVLASTDVGSYEEFTDIKKLQNCSDPMDAFALHKAALIACGVIPYEENVSVEEICAHLGGGLYMNTRVIDIPKGSGLGTSSILAAACVKGIFSFMGVKYTEDELYNTVLCMEQIMSTGGGWQDQVGGASAGIKMVLADKALKQKIICTPLRIDNGTLRELNERFALIYTGQRRLARNLLRDIVGKYVGGDPDVNEVLYRVQQMAVLMRLELEKGRIDGLAKLMNEHWELSKRLDKGCTNTCIDQIFLSIEDLIDGKMICGAGGGGFIQVIMKKGVTLEQMQERLDEVFSESGVGVWKTEFYMG